MFKAVIVKSLFSHKKYKNVMFKKFPRETLNLAVLDSGCTKTVCGQEWLKCYIKSLCDDDRRKIQEFTSETNFKFGDGKVLSLRKECSNSMQHCSQKCVTEDRCSKKWNTSVT